MGVETVANGVHACVGFSYQSLSLPKGGACTIAVEVLTRWRIDSDYIPLKIFLHLKWDLSRTHSSLFRAC